MKRILLLLGMLALFSVPAFGQGPGIRFGDQQPVQSGQTPGGPIYSVPNATINFCNSPANGSPCTNKAVTYTDITLTTACPSSQQVVLSSTNNCVATTDSYGNWGVWVSAGTYTFTIQIPGGASIGPYTVTLSGSGGSNILPLNNTFTGSNNFNGGLNALGNPIGAFSGIAVPTDCVSIASANPLIFTDAGVGCGGSGSSVIPSPQYQINFYPTPGTVGTTKGSNITTDATANNLNIPGTLGVTGTSAFSANSTFKGPRPFVGVDAYGAKGDGTTDDTTAIQNAINAVCSSGGTLIFPQGVYKVTQNQGGASSIAPIFTFPSGCQGTANGISIQGTGSGYQSGQQFAIPPMSQISVTAGANPSMGPVFFFGQNQFNNRVTGLNLQCYNQCVSMYGTAGVWMDHISTAVQNTGQGVQHGASFMADNVGVTVYDTFWVGCDYCNLDGYANNTTLPVLLFAGVTPLSGGRNISGLWTSRGGIWESGNILYDQRISAAAAGGNIHIQDLTLEEPGNNLPIMQVTSESGFMDFSTVYFSDVGLSDSSSAPSSALQFDANAIYTDILLDNVQTSYFNPAILLNSGSILGCQIRGSAAMNRDAINASGQFVSGCVSANNYGFDMVSAPTDTGVLSQFYNTNMNYGAGFFGSNNTTTPIRMTNNAGQNSTLGISPVGGFVMGGQNRSGYDTEIYRSALQTVGIRIAQTTAPTGPAAALGSGGSLTSGQTYYYEVSSVMVATTCLSANSSGPSAEVSATPSGGNLTVNLTWTPVTTGVGYCVWRGTATNAENIFFYVSGASSTSFSDTGGAGTAGTAPLYNQTFPTNPQFAFNLNTLTLPNLTVTGTCTGCGSPTGLTPGVVPQGNSSPVLVNSSPLLDNGNTTANTLTYAGSGGITAPKVTDSGLTSGNCVQAGTGGLLGTVSGPCSTGGTVTSVGTVAPLSGTVTTTGNLSCPTCVTASSPGAGIAHFAGSTQAVTSSAVNLASSDVTGITPVANGGTGTASPALVAGTNVTITGSWPNQTINSSGGGGGSVGPGTTNGIAYFNASTTVTSPTPPSVNGQYVLGYSVTGGASVPPTATLVGLTGGTIAGGSTSYITATADNSTVITHLVGGTASATLTLSTPATVLNANPVYSYSNHSSHTDTIAPAGGFTIQSGSSAAASTLSVTSGVECRLIIDPSNPTTNWLADCRPNGGAGSVAFSSVTSGTSTGTLLVGTGGSLGLTGTGTINANILNGVTLSGAAATGNCMVATSSSAADWGSCATLAFPATVTGGTTGHFTSFSASTTLAVNANLTDLSNTLTYAGTSGFLASLGPIEGGLSGGGVGQPFIFQEGTQPSSAANQDWCYASSTTHTPWCNRNNTAYAQLTFGPSASAASDFPSFGDTTGNTFVDSGIQATPTGLNTAISILPGCTTATYVYSPQAGGCVAPSGGGGGASVNVLDYYTANGANAVRASIAGDTDAFGFVARYNGVYGHFFINISTIDNSADTYNFGIYSCSITGGTCTGTLICSTGAIAGSTFATALGASGAIAFTGNCSLSAGQVYLFASSAITSNTLQVRPILNNSFVTPFSKAQVATSSIPSTVSSVTIAYGLAGVSSSAWFTLEP